LRRKVNGTSVSSKLNVHSLEFRENGGNRPVSPRVLTLVIPNEREGSAFSGVLTLVIPNECEGSAFPETKRHVPGCGGSSQVVKLSKDKNIPLNRTIYDENELLVGFPDSVVRILSVCTDLTVSDLWIEDKLKDFTQKVTSLRSTLRAGQESKEKFRKMMEEHLANQSAPDKSEPEK